MSKIWIVIRYFLLCGIFIYLAACSSVSEMVGELLPTPSPQPTLTPMPSVGQLGERMEWGGWAITVSNVLRSSLDPRELNPYQNRPGDRDYISMDVTVERTIDEPGNIDGERFTLIDRSGEVYKERYPLQNWVYDQGVYTLNEKGTDRIVIPVPKTVEELKLRFTPYPPIPAPLEIALDQVKQVRKIDLREAIELGLLTTEVRGMSLERIEVEFEVSAELEDSIEVSITPGTMFLAPSPDLQTMVVREEMIVFLTPKRELSVKLDVACANMTLKAPAGGETYIVQIEPPAEELRKLLGLPEFQDSSFRLQQFAIWTITDNPASGRYIGLGVGDQGSPPSRDELAQIRQWFEQAGIEVANYSGLR